MEAEEAAKQNSEKGTEENNKWKRIPYDGCSLDTQEEKERYEGDFHLEVAGQNFVFHQETVKTLGSVGLTVWDSAIVLAKYLEVLERKTPGFFDGKRVIELGAGCSIPGIVAASLGAIVTLTDVPRIIGIMRKNAENNLKDTKHPFRIKELTWGKTPIGKFKPPLDVILGADIIYTKQSIVPFLKTAYKLAGENTLFLLAFENHEEDAFHRFWEKVEEYFQVKKIPSEELHEYYQDEQIDVLSLTKKKVKPKEEQQQVTTTQENKEEEEKENKEEVVD